MLKKYTIESGSQCATVYAHSLLAAIGARLSAMGHRDYEAAQIAPETTIRCEEICLKEFILHVLFPDYASTTEDEIVWRTGRDRLEVVEALWALNLKYIQYDLPLRRWSLMQE